ADPVTGVVLDTKREPISNAAVEAYKEEKNEKAKKSSGKAMTKLVSRAETDANGKFSLGLPEGKFRLVASAKGFSQGSLSGITKGKKGVEIILGEGRGLVCLVKDEKEQPVAKARLSLFGESTKENSLFKKEAKSLVKKGDSIVEAPGSKPATELAGRVLHFTESPQARPATHGD